MLHILLLLIDSVGTHNIDTLDPILLSGNVSGEYFGYSVAVQKHGQASWVLVGAPRANVTINNGSVGLGWGGVYNCSRESGFTCRRLVLDEEPEVNKEVKEGQWTGVVLATHPHTYDAVTCAHRYTKRGYMNTGNELGIRGRCWTIPSDGASTETLPQLCTDINPQSMVDADRCQAGISAAYQQDYIDVGGSGYYQGKGRVMFYDTKQESIVRPNKAYTGTRDSKVYGYLGYAMASCSDKKTAATYLFVGAPRARGVKGKVDYFTYYSSPAAVAIKRLANGVDFGSYFGSSVTCGYTTKEDAIQVIIGAPMWYDKRKSNDFDRGRVYVYDVRVSGFPRHMIPGENAGDRFGTTVAVIGDINKDGLDDLAIGAPADLTPDAGRVYIYQGPFTRGIQIKHVQKLSPVAPQSPVSNGAAVGVYGFGSSINGGADVDNNNFPDIVVGAYQSDTAYIYRALPIININVTNYVNTTMVDKNETCLGETVACFYLAFNISYHPENLIAELNTTFRLSITNSLDIDSYSKRVRFADKSHENVTVLELKYGESADRSMGYLVYLRPVITDIKRLIKIRTQISVYPSADFENRISLNISQYTDDITQVKIKTSCGNATCETDLMLNSSQVYFDKSDGEGPRNDTLYSGYNDLIWSNYTITRNSSLGKPFGSHILLTMPHSVYVVNVLDSAGVKISICTPLRTETVGSYYCGLDSKLDKNDTAQFSFSVEYSVVGVQDVEEITVRMELVTEGSEDVNNQTNVVKHTVLVRRLAKIELSGTSSPSLNIFQIRKDKATINYVDDIGNAQYTTFLPVNLGPGYVENLKLIMEVPYAMNNSNSMDFIYPYAIGPTDIKCDKTYLNTKALPAKSQTKRSLKMDNRKTRETTWADVLPSTVSTSDTPDPIPHVTFECANGTAKCVNISCTVKNLPKGVIGIRLTSYVWEHSFDAATTISSSVRVWVENGDEGADLATSSVTGPIAVPLTIKAVIKLVKPVSMWIIIGAVTGGLCFLALVVVVLYKVGFFKRDRPPKAEFYGSEWKSAEQKYAIEVVDDTVQPNVSSDSEEDDGQYAFKNPVYDE